MGSGVLSHSACVRELQSHRCPNVDSTRTRNGYTHSEAYDYNSSMRWREQARGQESPRGLYSIETMEGDARGEIYHRAPPMQDQLQLQDLQAFLPQGMNPIPMLQSP